MEKGIGGKVLERMTEDGKRRMLFTLASTIGEFIVNIEEMLSFMLSNEKMLLENCSPENAELNKKETLQSLIPLVVYLDKLVKIQTDMYSIKSNHQFEQMFKESQELMVNISAIATPIYALNKSLILRERCLNIIKTINPEFDLTKQGQDEPNKKSNNGIITKI